MLLVAVDGNRPVRRRYTIRDLDPARQRLTLDIVRHGDGPGERWVRSARPGDTIEGIAPRGKIFVALEADWHLFAADESGLAAVFAMTGSLPAGGRATAFLEVPEAADEQKPDLPAGVSLTWLPRDGRGPPVTRPRWPRRCRRRSCRAGTGHFYLFGEARVVLALREVLAARGVPGEQVSAKAYWGRGKANAQHGEPARDGSPAAAGRSRDSGVGRAAQRLTTSGAFQPHGRRIAAGPARSSAMRCLTVPGSGRGQGQRRRTRASLPGLEQRRPASPAHGVAVHLDRLLRGSRRSSTRSRSDAPPRSASVAFSWARRTLIPAGSWLTSHSPVPAGTSAACTCSDSPAAARRPAGQARRRPGRPRTSAIRRCRRPRRPASIDRHSLRWPAAPSARCTAVSCVIRRAQKPAGRCSPNAQTWRRRPRPSSVISRSAPARSQPGVLGRVVREPAVRGRSRNAMAGADRVRTISAAQRWRPADVGGQLAQRPVRAAGHGLGGVCAIDQPGQRRGAGGDLRVVAVGARGSTRAGPGSAAAAGATAAAASAARARRARPSWPGRRPRRWTAA